MPQEMPDEMLLRRPGGALDLDQSQGHTVGADEERLLAYAHQQDKEHRPAWTAFNRRARAGKGHVGIWHETFIVPAGSYESVYVDMPAYGLGAATGVVPVGRRGDTAAQRLRAAER